MINLLATADKKNIASARSNVIVRRYVRFTILIIALAVLIFAGGAFLTIRDRQAAEQALATNKSELARYDKAKQEAQTFRENLVNANKILTSQVQFSNLITKIAKTLPSSSVLQSLAINTSDIGSKEPLIIEAMATNASSAPLQLKSSLNKSELFEDVSIISIAKVEITEDASAVRQSHPVNVSLAVKLTSKAGETE